MKTKFSLIVLLPLLLFILIVCNSCIKININDPNKKQSKAEGHVTDIITHEVLDNAKVEVLQWYESWFYPGTYFSSAIDSGRTDATGHFLINYHSNSKYTYSLRISAEKHFTDEGVRGLVTSISNINIALFPHGFIKTHIINKIAEARWIEFYFTPFYSSNSMFRDGFINTQLFHRAFADTTIVTTTIGGVTNNFKLSITPTDYTPDARVVKDTSFQTLRLDTLRLKFFLK